MTPQLFLGYAPTDGEAFASRLYDALSIADSGYDPWFDKRQVVDKTNIDLETVSAIESCHVFLFVLTPDSVTNSSECKVQWLTALRAQKFVIALRFDPTAELPHEMGQRSCIDFTTDFDAAFANLLVQLGEFFSGHDDVVAPPSAAPFDDHDFARMSTTDEEIKRDKRHVLKKAKKERRKPEGRHWLDQLVDTELDGRYVLKRFIAGGNFGAVFEGIDEKFENTVAIKLLWDTRKRSESAFRREAKLIREFQHPNVVRVYDYGTDESIGLGYIVMEFAEGDRLDEVFKKYKCRLPEHLLRKLVSEITAALEYAHTKQLIHRDLKPSNIILAYPRTPAERFVLMDLGVAAKMDASGTIRNDANDGAGTPAYGAPEQFYGKVITPACDIYSFGVILYELFTGRRPFADKEENRGELYLAISNVAPPRFDDIVPEREISPAIESVVLRCLEKDPENRPETMVQVRNELFAALGEPTETLTTLPPNDTLPTESHSAKPQLESESDEEDDATDTSVLIETFDTSSKSGTVSGTIEDSHVPLESEIQTLVDPGSGIERRIAAAIRLGVTKDLRAVVPLISLLGDLGNHRRVCRNSGYDDEGPVLERVKASPDFETVQRSAALLKISCVAAADANGIENGSIDLGEIVNSLRRRSFDAGRLVKTFQVLFPMPSVSQIGLQVAAAAALAQLGRDDARLIVFAGFKHPSFRKYAVAGMVALINGGDDWATRIVLDHADREVIADDDIEDTDPLAEIDDLTAVNRLLSVATYDPNKRIHLLVFEKSGLSLMNWVSHFQVADTFGHSSSTAIRRLRSVTDEKAIRRFAELIDRIDGSDSASLKLLSIAQGAGKKIAVPDGH